MFWGALTSPAGAQKQMCLAMQLLKHVALAAANFASFAALLSHNCGVCADLFTPLFLHAGSEKEPFQEFMR